MKKAINTKNELSKVIKFEWEYRTIFYYFRLRDPFQTLVSFSYIRGDIILYFVPTHIYHDLT